LISSNSSNPIIVVVVAVVACLLAESLALDLASYILARSNTKP